MNDKSYNMLSFIFGCAFGSVVTYFLAKNIFNKKLTESQAELESELSDKVRKDIIKEYHDFDNIIRDYGYAGRDTPEDVKEPKCDPTDNIYYIPIDEYGELHDYETFNLILYSDNVLVDEDDEMIDDPVSILGADIFKALCDREYGVEGDSYFIRNDEKKCDYEISLSEMTYREIAYEKPNIVLHGEEEYDY